MSGRSNLPSGAQRVLFVRLRSLGDTVLMTPSLEVAKRVPGSTVGVVVEAPFHQVLKGNPHLDQIFVVPGGSNKWSARLGVIAQVRRFQPQLAVDLHGGTTSALLTLASGAKRRAGYAHSRNSWAYNVKVPDSAEIWGRNEVHTVEHQLSILKHLGFPVDPPPAPTVSVDPEDLEWARDRLRLIGVDEGFVLIHPAAAFETKRWDGSKFSALAAGIVEQGRQVVVTAGPGEESLLRSVEDRSHPEVRSVPPQEIGRFTALLSLCGLFVGNDTGSTHIAAALKKRTVVIFGSSDYRVWHPWKTEHRLVRSDLPCIPCPGYTCLHYEEPRCIREISVETVMDAVRSLL